ncbi:MAG: glycine cleavage system aminomethyltransferase GcvT [Gammaproteobacteria bacterium]|nr:glycine cleavage system aminomethyltransferase GcvT [Gammaproteobacteria bacterium]
MGKQTPFYAQHVKAQAKIVDFAGWDMPLHYGSQIEEHHIVRREVGMFDVSHMGVVDISGKDAAPYLRYLLANNIDRITPGRAIYTCMLNEKGGVIDDLIVYKLSETDFRIVINAGTREKDLAWMRKQSNAFELTIQERLDLCMLAIQGPLAYQKVAEMDVISKEDLSALKNFSFLTFDDWLIARTGYTGEEGVEMIFPVAFAESIWEKALVAGIKPCGLGSRDTLRLEAGLNLYGNDMDETVTPLESNLSWTVAMEPTDRDFIGRKALSLLQNQNPAGHMVGLVLEGPGVIRNHQRVVFANGPEGYVTSGGYSPTLAKSIALARVPVQISETCTVEIRNKAIPAKIVKPPFVRKGKKMFE